MSVETRGDNLPPPPVDAPPPEITAIYSTNHPAQGWHEKINDIQDLGTWAVCELEN